jgi:hypothetical protein
MSQQVQRIALVVGILAGLVLVAVASNLAGQPPASPQPSPSQRAPSISGHPSASIEPTSPTGPSEAPPASAPASTAPVAVLVGAGDIAACRSSGDEATANLLEAIEGTVFTLGDNVYDNGTATEFSDCYSPSWGRPSIKNRTRPVPGNHDYNTRDAAGYYDYFGAAAGDPAKGYYAYDAAAWRVYVLNSNCSFVSCSAGSAQEQWLRGDLAANPRACVLAMWHHPRFSSGSEHGSSTATQALWQALYDFDADLVLSGHEHDYERFAPQTATGRSDNTRGIVEIVVGTGGRSHYLFGPAIANSVVRNDTTYGVLRLDLFATSWSFTFIPVAGKTFTDTGTGTCH